MKHVRLSAFLKNAKGLTHEIYLTQFDKKQKKYLEERIDTRWRQIGWILYGSVAGFLAIIVTVAFLAYTGRLG